MSDLRDLVILQTRYAEFLEGLDQATVRAIIDGTAQLAVQPVGSATVDPSTRAASPSRPPSFPGSATVPEPGHVAQELRRMMPGSQRSLYLNRAGLTVSALRQVAKLLGISGYTKLRKSQLIELLAGHLAADGVTASAVPVTSIGPSPTHQHQHMPESAAPASVVGDSNADAAAIAAHLRTLESEDVGAAYLRERTLDRVGLLAVATELRLTRVDRLSRGELEKRILKQAISARRKFAGLRKW